MKAEAQHRPSSALSASLLPSSRWSKAASQKTKTKMGSGPVLTWPPTHFSGAVEGDPDRTVATCYLCVVDSDLVSPSRHLPIFPSPHLP